MIAYLPGPSPQGNSPLTRAQAVLYYGGTGAAALVLTYRTEAQLVPAYVRSVERWLATAAR